MQQVCGLRFLDVGQQIIVYRFHVLTAFHVTGFEGLDIFCETFHEIVDFFTALVVRTDDCFRESFLLLTFSGCDDSNKLFICYTKITGALRAFGSAMADASSPLFGRELGLLLIIFFVTTRSGR